MTRDRAPSVTVYILCHNYGRFLADAIASVQAQVFPDWELIVLDDGSTDDTQRVLDPFRNEPRLKILANGDHRGLRRSANRCIKEARGDYILRLDADDLLHPHALDAFRREASRSPDVSVFFSDYYYIDESGEILGVEAFSDGERASTFPPHGSGSFVRKDTFQRIGFYDESLDTDFRWAAGHGHEFWLKLQRAGLRAQHVPLPLFSYRQHGPSVSSDVGTLVRAQGAIKRRLADGLDRDETVIAVIPVRNAGVDVSNLPFMRFEGTTLLERAIDAGRAAVSVSRVLVTTDDPEVGRFVEARFPDVPAFVRPSALRSTTTSIQDVLRDVVGRAGFRDEVILCLLNVRTPRRTGFHVQKAIDNFLLYDVDSVVAVHEERNPIYQMGPSGLRAVNPAFHHHHLRREREAVYIDNGAVRVFRVGNLREEAFMGHRIGHSLMAPADNIQIESSEQLYLLDQPIAEAPSR